MKEQKWKWLILSGTCANTGLVKDYYWNKTYLRIKFSAFHLITKLYIFFVENLENVHKKEEGRVGEKNFKF